MQLQSTAIAPPNPPLYQDWWIEISCDDLFGQEWDEADLDLFEPETHLTPPPHGWTITGWEYYPHKDAAGVLAIYLAPPPATLELRQQAAAIGRDILTWIDQLDEWRASLAADLENPLPWRWHLTDLRHLSNLGSAKWQGFLPKDTPTPETPKNHAIMALEDNVQDWLEDHFAGEGEDDESE